MKRLLLSLLLLSQFLSQAGEITLNFVKNKEGEVLLMVAGHTDSVIVKLNDQTFTLYKEDDRLNLSGIVLNAKFSFQQRKKHQIPEERNNKRKPNANAKANCRNSSPLFSMMGIIFNFTVSL